LHIEEEGKEGQTEVLNKSRVRKVDGNGEKKGINPTTRIRKENSPKPDKYSNQTPML